MRSFQRIIFSFVLTGMRQLTEEDITVDALYEPMQAQERWSDQYRAGVLVACVKGQK